MAFSVSYSFVFRAAKLHDKINTTLFPFLQSLPFFYFVHYFSLILAHLEHFHVLNSGKWHKNWKVIFLCAYDTGYLTWDIYFLSKFRPENFRLIGKVDVRSKRCPFYCRTMAHSKSFGMALFPSPNCISVCISQARYLKILAYHMTHTTVYVTSYELLRLFGKSKIPSLYFDNHLI